MFFYKSHSIKKEFRKYGLVELVEVDKPNKTMENKCSMKFIMIKYKNEL